MKKLDPSASIADAQWCITIPAIWEQHARLATRHAAELAGLIATPEHPAGSPIKVCCNTDDLIG